MKKNHMPFTISFAVYLAAGIIAVILFAAKGSYLSRELHLRRYRTKPSQRNSQKYQNCPTFQRNRRRRLKPRFPKNPKRQSYPANPKHHLPHLHRKMSSRIPLPIPVLNQNRPPMK